MLTLLLVLALPIQQDPGLVEHRVDSLVTAAMAERRIPGAAVAVAHRGRLVLSRSYGTASVELDAPVTPASVFLLASITKTFTATSILMLAREGKVDLDAPVEQYLGPVPEAWKPITIRHLLTHTAGLRDRFELTADYRMYMEYSTRQMRAAAEATPVDFAPGTRVQYSDQGYFLLGQVIEQVTGKNYRQFLTDRIFGPAGLTSATTHSQRDLVPGRVPTYLLRQDGLTPAPRSYHFGLVSHYGVMATADDLARYGVAVLGGKLLPVPVLDSMWRPAAVADGSPARTGVYYHGLGWFLDSYLGRTLAFHAGSTGTMLLLSPADSLAVVVLTNLEQAAGSNAPGLARQVAEVVVPGLGWKDAAPVLDPAPEFTALVRRELEGLAAGTADSTAYTPGFWDTLRRVLPAQQAGLRQLGPLTSLIHLSSAAAGTETLVAWRARFGEALFLARVVRDRSGRIDHLGLQR